MSDLPNEEDRVPLTPEELKEATLRAEFSTPGNWEVAENKITVRTVFTKKYIMPLMTMSGESSGTESDARFVAFFQPQENQANADRDTSPQERITLPV